MGHSYEFYLVVLSIVIALVGSYVALDFSEQATIAEEEIGRFRWLFGGGIALGMTIWSMHFTAMLAFRTGAPITWDFVVVFVAMMVAITGSTAGLIVVGRRQVLARWALLGGSIFVGFAIVGMHFAAMEALSLIPTQGARNPSEQPVSAAFSNSLLGWIVGGVSLFVLILTLVGSSYGRKARAKAAGEEAGRQAREEGERRFRSLVQNSSEVVKITDPDGTLRYASPAFGRVFGHDPEEAIGKNILDYVHPDDLPRIQEETEKALKDPEIDSNVAEYRFQHADGSWRHVEAVGTYMLDDPSVEGVVVNVRDITERKEFEDRLAYQAFHDPLTGLPNRALLLDRLRQALSRSRQRVDRGSNEIALLFLDLDDFKEINDSLGHDAGDELLVAVAERLGKAVRPEDTLARLGGDEFCVLLEDLDGSGTGSGAAEAAQAAERISEELGRSRFKLGERDRQENREEECQEEQKESRQHIPTEVPVTASIGIALSGGSFSSRDFHHRPLDLLKEADLAVYRAKETGKGGYKVFEPSLAQEVEDRMRLKSDLGRALENGEFELYYQPKVCLKTGKILWMEGLLRWNHPERGLLLPGGFTSAAEESGLIVPIGRWAIGEILKQGRRWADQSKEGSTEEGIERAAEHDSHSSQPFNQPSHRPPVPAVCVNLSAKQLDQEGLAQDIADMLRETQTDPQAFGVEITESVLMEDEHSLATLEELRGMRLTISIDDFGTGYASLSYLKRFPANILKIDCSFIEGFEDHPQDAVMVSGMINLAHATGKQVVAECVENARQLALLSEMNCEMGQGHLFSEPLPPEAAAKLVANYSPDDFLKLSV